MIYFPLANSIAKIRCTFKIVGQCHALNIIEKWIKRSLEVLVIHCTIHMHRTGLHSSVPVDKIDKKKSFKNDLKLVCQTLFLSLGANRV